MDPDRFPALLTIVDRNSSIFFINRVFKHPDHPDYMPVYKVEDLLSGQSRMLAFLVHELCKHADKLEQTTSTEDDKDAVHLWRNRARGVWMRNKLSSASV